MGNIYTMRTFTETGRFAKATGADMDLDATGKSFFPRGTEISRNLEFIRSSAKPDREKLANMFRQAASHLKNGDVNNPEFHEIVHKATEHIHEMLAKKDDKDESMDADNEEMGYGVGLFQDTD